MISVQSVSMRFGSKVLFEDVTTTFSAGRRYGLTGRPDRLIRVGGTIVPEEWKSASQGTSFFGLRDQKEAPIARLNPGRRRLY